MRPARQAVKVRLQNRHEGSDPICCLRLLTCQKEAIQISIPANSTSRLDSVDPPHVAVVTNQYPVILHSSCGDNLVGGAHCY